MPDGRKWVGNPSVLCLTLCKAIGFRPTEVALKIIFAWLVKRMRAPRYLITDGAIELIESADTLKNKGKKTILLRDMRHFAANVLENLIGRNERFTSCLSELGRTASRMSKKLGWVRGYCDDLAIWNRWAIGHAGEFEIHQSSWLVRRECRSIANEPPPTKNSKLPPLPPVGLKT